MLSHPPSGRVPAHCVVRVSLDARPLASPPALGLRRPLGFLDPIVALDYHAPYFRAYRPYIGYSHNGVRETQPPPQWTITQIDPRA